MLRIIRLAGAALLALPLWAAAHQEGESGAQEDIYAMDCEHPPKDAVRKLPEAFARWASLLCMPTGHVLVQSEDAQWRYPGSFTSKVMFPARSGLDENDGRPRYFTRVAIRQLNAEEARAQHARLVKENPLYADRSGNAQSGAPESAWEVVGTNNANVSYQIYLMRGAGAQDILAMMCAPTCEAQYTFIVTPYQ